MISPLRTRIVPYVAAALVVMAAARVEAASLSEARDLYAAAAYGDALRMLDGLLQGGQAREDRQAIDLYRVLCLVALGRQADADLAIEQMIQRDPFYRVTTDDVPPRLRASFADTRKRLLPVVVQQDYTAAKSAFDRKDFARAGETFGHVLKLLAEPEIAPQASRPPLSDLKTLAEGFRDLSVKSGAPPASRELPVAGRIYTAEDRRVVPPAIVKQRVPPFRGKFTSPGEGVLEIIIGSTGEVESARMVVPLQAQYDAQVVNAAKGWQYKPATFNGVPVMFRKQVKISLVAGGQ
jgi:Gram-negative bacterial TonB protein C-terminal